MIISRCEQGSDEWLLARTGLATASEFSSVLAKGQGKTRASYLRRVVAERLTAKPTETYKNGHMERGQEQEPMARLAYEELSGTLVDPVGFIRHSRLMAGCSPDALVDEHGALEIKCVIPTVQLETILSGGMPPEHRAQVQGVIWLAERAWCDFVSFSPDMPKHLALYRVRVMRDDDYIRDLQAEVAVFLQDVDKLVAQLMGYKP